MKFKTICLNDSLLSAKYSSKPEGDRRHQHMSVNRVDALRRLQPPQVLARGGLIRSADVSATKRLNDEALVAGEWRGRKGV